MEKNFGNDKLDEEVNLGDGQNFFSSVHLSPHLTLHL